MCIGVATQYAGDVIGNILDGKTGLDILKPTSSIGEYVSAGVTALIPGKGLGGALVRNVVSETIVSVENAYNGERINVVDSVISIGTGAVLDATFEKVTDGIVDFIDSKAPQNYSSYAHTVRQSSPNLTRSQIYRSMQRSIRVNRFASDAISFAIDAVRSCLPY